MTNRVKALPDSRPPGEASLSFGVAPVYCLGGGRVATRSASWRDSSGKAAFCLEQASQSRDDTLPDARYLPNHPVRSIASHALCGCCAGGCLSGYSEGIGNPQSIGREIDYLARCAQAHASAHRAIYKVRAEAESSYPRSPYRDSVRAGAQRLLPRRAEREVGCNQHYRDAEIPVGQWNRAHGQVGCAQSAEAWAWLGHRGSIGTQATVAARRAAWSGING